jgi:uncharacterized protein YkwD
MPARRALRRIVGALVIVASVATLGISASATAAGAATIDGNAESVLYGRTNDARGGAGLAPLANDPAAREIARSWAAHLADSGALVHNPNLVAQVNAYVTTQWSRIGENVGRGWDVGSLADAFMASSPHRANILGAYNRIGVGAARDGGGQLWVAVVFIQGPPLAPAVSPGAWAPFSSPEAFAAQQYADFLNRPGDPAGIAFWADRLRAGVIAGPGVVDWFLNSPEFGGAIAPVVRLYLGGIGRLPDAPGLRYWLDTAVSGVPLGTIAHAFASNGEFQQRYGGLDEAGFVNALYWSIFGRPADPSGLAYWTGELTSGRMVRGWVLLGLTSSPEFVWRTRAATIVTMAYVGMLRRSPEPTGFDYWVSVLQSGHGIGEFAAGVLSSPEYAARVGA